MPLNTTITTVDWPKDDAHKHLLDEVLGHWHPMLRRYWAGQWLCRALGNPVPERIFVFERANRDGKITKKWIYDDRGLSTTTESPDKPTNMAPFLYFDVAPTGDSFFYHYISGPRSGIGMSCQIVRQNGEVELKKKIEFFS